ncbi:glycoside hydrolase family 28 protein [Dinghuibacter silviterrae]|uniref:Polygalacturonase n=1 Tax=Dinghuibacter silviterrae TaxID=1539049 RepID=A0A4V3GKP3_9BACT|nr:glycoside hydrolase family 28 protein [Dinghuibacter silviterrae]TDW96432.1 polygalacturonase [Dinghuibacter silviterrae]
MKTLCFVLACFLLTGARAQDKSEARSTAGDVRSAQDYVRAAPFPMALPALPELRQGIFLITDFGAIGDGQALNTAAFSKAIAACTQAGGGRVIVPPGLWLTGPIRLASNVNLEVQRGALIQFTRDRTQYPPQGSNPTPLVYGENLHDVAITGGGILDGGGDAWRPVKKEKVTDAQWKAMLASGGTLSNNNTVWWPGTEAKDYRPYMINLVGCTRVLFKDVTFRNSPKFVVDPNKCTDLTLDGINVFNEYYAQNGDGIDISACKNVLLYHCNVSAGDDGICMKSSGDWMTAPDSAALENVVIAGCHVYHAHGGFVIGSNTDGGMRRIFVTDCDYVGTDIGIRVKSNAGRGGLVREVYVDNIFMTDIVHEAISFNTYYEDMPAGADPNKRTAPKPGKTPIFTGFHISNVYCRGAAQAIALTGLPEMPVHGIYFDRVRISARTGLTTKDARDIFLRRVSITTEQGVPLKPEHPDDIRVVE